MLLQVLIWNVQDHDAGSLLTPIENGTTRQPQPGTRLQARTTLEVGLDGLPSHACLIVMHAALLSDRAFMIFTPQLCSHVPEC